MPPGGVGRRDPTIATPEYGGADNFDCLIDHHTANCTHGNGETELIQISPQLCGTKPPQGIHLPFAEFIHTHFDHHHYEWVDGTVVELCGVDNEHAEIFNWLMCLLAVWIESKDGGEILTRPFLMRLEEVPCCRMPDLQVIKRRSLPKLKKFYLDGPADVVVEIVSTGSRTTDRRTKFTEYEQGGVREYWIIDPLRRQAEFYVLEKKRFIPAPVDEEEGRFHSRRLPGVWLDVDWLWKRPPKKQILKLWGVS